MYMCANRAAVLRPRAQLEPCTALLPTKEAEFETGTVHTSLRSVLIIRCDDKSHYFMTPLPWTLWDGGRKALIKAAICCSFGFRPKRTL